MTIFTAIIVYLMVFWTTLFLILPWGNKPQETPEEGMAGSAPANPRIKKKFLITFIISTIIWLIVLGLIHFQVVDFYEISRQMVKEDMAR